MKKEKGRRENEIEKFYLLKNKEINVFLRNFDSST